MRIAASLMMARWFAASLSIGELARHWGLTFAYHNHDFEFSNLTDGARPFDLLLAHTDNRFVKFEPDVYWAKKSMSMRLRI
jgi:hypothetical protein